MASQSVGNPPPLNPPTSNENDNASSENDLSKKNEVVEVAKKTLNEKVSNAFGTFGRRARSYTFSYPGEKPPSENASKAENTRTAASNLLLGVIPQSPQNGTFGKNSLWRISTNYTNFNDNSTPLSLNQVPSSPSEKVTEKPTIQFRF